jgi:predicted nucleotidyltransferase
MSNTDGSQPSQSGVSPPFDTMEIRPGLAADDDALAAFCRRHGIHRLALFGSALRDDFRNDSDVDVLVEFEPGRTPGLLALASMELELGEMFAHEVELRTYDDLSRYFRDRVRASARELYAAA